MKRFLFSMLGLIILLSTGSYAQAIQITNNSLIDARPMIDNGVAVWREHDGNDWEVFIYDSSTGITTQLTNNSFDDGVFPGCLDQLRSCDRPHIKAGKVVWSGYDGADYEIFLYDIASGVTAQLTNNSFDEWQARVDGEMVSWYGFDGTDTEIFLYNSSTGVTTQITNNAFYDSRPRISNGRVTWIQFDGADSEIFLYDTATGITTQVTNNAYYDNYPVISSYLIAWQGMVDADGEVFIYDISTGTVTQVTNNGFIEESIDADLTANGIGWEAFDGTDSEIFHYNVATGITTQITNNSSEDYDGNVSNGQVVWIGFDGTDTEIYMYDVNKGMLVQITNNTLFDDGSGPRIDSGQVVWAGGCSTECASSPTETEIFMYSIVPMPNIKANGSNGPVVVIKGTTVTVTISLDPATYAGAPADHWVVAATPNGVYWYNSTGKWVKSDTPVRGYGGPLTNLNNYMVFNASILPVGPTFFYFAVDNNANNVFDATWWDYVVVKVE